MEITHLPEDNLFKTVVDGYTQQQKCRRKKILYLI